MIDQNKIKEIIDKTDIVALVSQYVKLTKAGSDYKGLCPFHNEKTPSFMVSPSKKIAKCMSCGKGGSPITFLMQIKNISFQEACIELAEKANVKLDIAIKKSGPDYSKYYKIMDEAQKFYKFNLLSTKSGLEALNYLKKRGITKEIIDKFNIGLSPKKSDSLYLTLKDLGYNEIDLIECGLIKESDNSDSFYDLFRNRIMFPVTDKDSNVIAFSARIFNGEENQAKYVNSPETKIFKKNQSIYHLDLARPSILKNKRVILHEGQMDVIASCKAGFNEAVCSMGTSLTQNQVKLLRTFTENVVLCYDGDSAGIKAMIKAVKLLELEKFKVSVVSLPNNMDPDEFVSKKGIDEYNKYFNSHLVNPNDFIFNYLTLDKDYTNSSVIETTKKNLFSYINTLNSQVLVENYLNKFATLTGISNASLILDYNSFMKGKTSTFVEHAEPIIKSSKQNYLCFNDNDWQNCIARQKAELKLFEYAKKSKSLAKQIDEIVENNYNKVSIYDCFDTNHKNLWDSLYNDYYQFCDEFEELKFLKLIKGYSKDNENNFVFNCYVSDKNTKKNYIDKSHYSESDLNLCVKTIFNYYDLKKSIECKNSCQINNTKKQNQDALQELLMHIRSRTNRNKKGEM